MPYNCCCDPPLVSTNFWLLCQVPTLSKIPKMIAALLVFLSPLKFSTSNDAGADGAGHRIWRCFLAAAGPFPNPETINLRKGDSSTCLSSNRSWRMKVSKFCSEPEDGCWGSPQLKSPSISDGEFTKFSKFSNSDNEIADAVGHWIWSCFLAAAGPSPIPDAIDSRKGYSATCLSSNSFWRAKEFGSKFCGGPEVHHSGPHLLKFPSIPSGESSKIPFPKMRELMEWGIRSSIAFWQPLVHPQFLKQPIPGKVILEPAFWKKVPGEQKSLLQNFAVNRSSPQKVASIKVPFHSQWRIFWISQFHQWNSRKWICELQIQNFLLPFWRQQLGNSTSQFKTSAFWQRSFKVCWFFCQFLWYHFRLPFNKCTENTHKWMHESFFNQIFEAADWNWSQKTFSTRLGWSGNFHQVISSLQICTMCPRKYSGFPSSVRWMSVETGNNKQDFPNEWSVSGECIWMNW